MTTLREAAQQALDEWRDDPGSVRMASIMMQLRAALQQTEYEVRMLQDQNSELDRKLAALEQPKQEPVAWGCSACGGTSLLCPHGRQDTPLYTHPPRREWRGLTEEEIDELHGSPMALEHSGELRWVRVIEAALKEKNHE